MVHIIFDSTNVGYGDFVQEGSGLEEELNYFRGAAPYQRGYGFQTGDGIGSVFKGLWRFFLPVLRRVGTTVGEEALNTGHRIMDRMKEGESLKNALTNEGKRGIDNVLDKGGLPKQFGTGKRSIKRKGKKPFIPNHHTLVGRVAKKTPAKKRIRVDAFGLY